MEQGDAECDAGLARATAFVEWLESDEAQQLIQSFEKDRHGESLFFPDSDGWRKRHGS